MRFSSSILLLYLHQRKEIKESVYSYKKVGYSFTFEPDLLKLLNFKFKGMTKEVLIVNEMAF